MKTNILMKKVFTIVAAGIVFAVLFSNSSTAAAAEPINIGFTLDFTGPAAPEAGMENPSIELAAKEINAKGGINGRPIKFFTLDNGSDPSRVVGALTVLKERDKCVAAYYSGTSAGGLAALNWGEQNHFPVIAANPYSDKLSPKEGKTWFFRSNTPNSELNMAILERIKSLGYKRVGLFGVTQSLGTDTLAVLKENVAKFGLELVGSVLCEPKSKDLTIQATTLRKTNPEAVVCAHYTAETSVWARSLKTIGWKPFNFVTLGMGPFYEILHITEPELLEGWETLAFVDIDKPGVTQLWDKLKAETKKDLYGNDLVTLAWDGAQVLFEAIRLSGNPDSSDAIREGFYKMKNFPALAGPRGLMATFDIGRNYYISSKELCFVAVKSGKFAAVPR